MRDRLKVGVLRSIFFWRGFALLRPEGCMLMVGAKVVDIAGQLSLILTHSPVLYRLSMFGPGTLSSALTMKCSHSLDPLLQLPYPSSRLVRPSSSLNRGKKSLPIGTAGVCSN